PRAARALPRAVGANGVGLGATRRVVDQSGLGLSNLANRLRTLYGEDATVALPTAAGGGAVTEGFVRADLVAPDADGGAATDDEAAEPAPVELPELFRRNLVATVVTGWLVWGLFWVQLNLTWMWIFPRRAR